MVLSRAAAAAQTLLRLGWCCSVFGSITVLQQTAGAQEVPGISCVVVANADTGGVFALGHFPGGGVLIGAEKGLFLAREVGGKVTITPAGGADTGRVFALRDFPGGEALILTEKGWFLGREASGKVRFSAAGGADIGFVFALRDLPGGRVLILAEKGLFLARE